MEHFRWHNEPSIVPNHNPALTRLAVGGKETVDEMTLAEAAERFLRARALDNLAASSLKQYDLKLQVFARYCERRRVGHVNRLRHELISDWLAERHASVRQGTVCHDRCVVHGFAVWLRENHLSGVEPDRIPHVSAPHADEVRRPRLSGEECRGLFEGLQEAATTFTGLRDLVIFGLLFGVGLRIGEVAAIRVSDLNLEILELWVPQSKGNVSRVCVIPESVGGWLRAYLDWRARAIADQTWLFVSNRRSRFSPHTLGNRIVKIGRAFGLSLTSHMGRRYCLTKLAAVNVFAAQELAGHKELATTRAYVPKDLTLLHRLMREHDPLR